LRIILELSFERSNLPLLTTRLKKNAVPKPERAARANELASTKVRSQESWLRVIMARGIPRKGLPNGRPIRLN
jgi:hypothetical protein